MGSWLNFNVVSGRCFWNLSWKCYFSTTISCSRSSSMVVWTQARRRRRYRCASMVCRAPTESSCKQRQVFRLNKGPTVQDKLYRATRWLVNKERVRQKNRQKSLQTNNWEDWNTDRPTNRIRIRTTLILHTSRRHLRGKNLKGKDIVFISA